MRAFLAFLCVSACCLATCLPSWAQAAELRLRVIDAQDGDALIGATLALVDGGAGGHADAQGRCLITVPKAGRYDLFVSFIGYRSRLLKGVASGDELVVALDVAAVSLADVVVSASRRVQSIAEAPIQHGP